MADENTEIQEQQTQETTPQQQGIQFEDILPWGTTGGDTGLSARLKLKRNFEKIKAWMDSFGQYLNLDDKYLSKTKDDEAAGEIGFLKGLWIKAKGVFGWDSEGNIKANDVTASGLLKSLKAQIDEIKSSNNNGSGLFESGWFVTNNHNGHSYMEIDELFVRMKAVFAELEIRKETHSGGNVFYSPAGSVIYKVECYKYDSITGEPKRIDAKTETIVRPFTAGGRMLALLSEKTGLFSHREVVTVQLDFDHSDVDFYRCYLIADDGTTQTRNWWRKDDQARCQTFNRAYDKQNTDTSDQPEPQFDDNYVQRNMDGNRFFWRLVINTGSKMMEDGKWYDYVDLSNQNHDEDSGDGYNYYEANGFVPGSDFPVAGDTIVCVGNRIEEERMNLVMLEVIGENAPAIKMYRGINTFSFEGRLFWNIGKDVQFRVGSIKYITDYGTPVPTKVWRDYWEPGVRYHYYDEVSHAGSTWLCAITDEYKWEHANGDDVQEIPSKNIIINGEGLFTYGQSGGKVLQDRYYATAVVSGETIYMVRNYTTVEPSDAAATIWHKEVSAGGSGTRGAFKSRVFARTNTDISSAQYTPTGGDYDNPWPGGAVGTTQHGVTWYDGIPNGSAMLWSSVCTFSDGVSPVWSRPAPETDTRTQDLEYSLSETRPDPPSGDTPYEDHSQDSNPWYDPSKNNLPQGVTWDDMIWRAERKVINGVYSGDWVITKILGEDGDPTPSYVEIQEAWSNEATASGMPSDCVETDWKSSTPPNTNNRKYLWRRSRTRVWDSATESYTTPTWIYVRLNGTNGTSIETKGVVESTSYLLDRYVRPYINGATVPESQKVAVSDGWAYVNNSDGHLYQWSDELRSKSGSWSGWNSGWIDLGKFQGDPGVTYYTHVAWGKNVIIGTPTYTPTLGQRTTPNASACEAFSPAPAEGYDFMGILIDQVSDDCTYWQNYTWQNTKGSAGPAGGSTATVYLYKRSASPISTVGITAGTLIDGERYLFYKFEDKKLYTNAACTYEFTDKTSGSNGWSPVIPSGTDPIYVTAAIAYSETATDNIGSNEWVTPAQFTENGINSATVFLYKRAAAIPDDTNSNYKCPQQTLYYKFADGKLYKDSALTQLATKNDGLNGWEMEVPATDGNPCYIIQAAALSSKDYDAIEVTKSGSTYTKNDWSGVRKLVEDGVTPTVDIVEIDGEMHWVINGRDTGVVAEGKEGTGVEIKGSVDSYSKLESTGYVTPVGGSRRKADKGDCYVCDDSTDTQHDRHLFMWDNTVWFDLGEFKGEPGKNSVIHIAYATGNPLNVTTDNVNNIGFTVDYAGADYDWWGFYSDNNRLDPGYDWSSIPDTTEGKQRKVEIVNTYKWNYMKGKDGNGMEYVYLLTKEGFKPTIDNSSYVGEHGDPSKGEFYPKVGNYSGNSDKIYGASQYWNDDPPASVSETWPMLWWSSRKYKDGTGWSSFGRVDMHNRWSKDGESAWVADFDNEMDSVSCDDSGYVLPTANGGSQSVGTTVNLYLGTEKVYSKIYAVSRNGSGMTNGVASNGVTASWPTAAGTDRTLTISYASTAKIDGKDDFTITITDADSANPRTLHFTVNGIKGDVYNLKPGNSSIVGTRNASNTLNITGIICGYTKKGIDGNVTTVDDVSDTHPSGGPYPFYIDGKYNIWYHRRLRSTGDWESGTYNGNFGYWYHAYNNETDRYNIVSAFDPNTYDAVEFVLCTEAGNTRHTASDTLSGVIDRETVPVVADGATGAAGVGENAVRIDLDNEMDAVSVDSSGTTVRFDRTVTTVARIYDGATKVQNGISHSMSAASLKFGNETVTVSGPSSDGDVTITWAFVKGNTISAASPKTITLSYNGVDYTAKFTLKAMEYSAIYQCAPSPSALSFDWDVTNQQYTPRNVTLYYGYTKDEGNGQVYVAQPSEYTIDNKYYIARRTFRIPSGQSTYSWSSWAFKASDLVNKDDSFTATSIEMCITTASNAANISDANIIDREVIPIVREGKDGSASVDIDAIAQQVSGMIDSGLFVTMNPQNIFVTQNTTDDVVFGHNYYAAIDVYRNDAPVAFSISSVAAYYQNDNGIDGYMDGCASASTSATTTGTKNVYLTGIIKRLDSSTSRYYYYDHGYIQFTVTVEDKSYTLKVAWYMNQLGRRRVEDLGDIQTTYMSRTEYALSDSTDNLLRGTQTPQSGDGTGNTWATSTSNYCTIGTVTDSPVSGYNKTYRIEGATGVIRTWYQASTFWSKTDTYHFKAYARGIGGSAKAVIRIYETVSSSVRFEKQVSVGSSWTALSFSATIPAFAGNTAWFILGIYGSGTIEYVAPVLTKAADSSVIKADYDGKITTSAAGIRADFKKVTDVVGENGENFLVLQEDVSHFEQTADAIRMGVSSGWKNYITNPLSTDATVYAYSLQDVVTDDVFGEVRQIQNTSGGDWQLLYNLDASYQDLNENNVTWFCIVRYVGVSETNPRMYFGSGYNTTKKNYRAIMISASSDKKLTVECPLSQTYFSNIKSGCSPIGAELGKWYLCWVSAKMAAGTTIIDGSQNVGFNSSIGTWRLYYGGIVMGTGCPSIDAIRQGSGVMKAGIDIERGMIRLDAERTIVTGNLQAKGIDTEETAGHRIHIEGGTFNVYDNNGNVGLRIGWDDTDNGAPYIILCNSDGSKSYKLTYDGVKTASGTFTNDDLNTTSLRLNPSGYSASVISANTYATYYYKYNAAKNNVTGAYSRQNPNSSSVYDDSWAALRSQYDNKWFNTQSVSNVLQSNTSYMIADGYYIATTGTSQVVGTKTIYTRAFYAASGGTLSSVGSVYYYLDGSVGMWCESDGTGGQKQFDPNRYLKPTRE